MSRRTTMRRFYTEAAAEPAPDGHAVTLDGRPVRSRATRAPLVVPTHALAAAIADEWANQGETVDPAAMPLTTLATTAFDAAIPRREELVEEAVNRAATDAVCYRTPYPEALARRQEAHWHPVLDWLALQHDARLNTTTGIRPVAQPPDALSALRNALNAYGPLELAAVIGAVRATDSVVLALALAAGRLGAGDAFDAAELEATHEIEQWGLDGEQEARRTAVLDELRAAERFLQLLQADG